MKKMDNRIAELVYRVLKAGDIEIEGGETNQIRIKDENGTAVSFDESTSTGPSLRFSSEDNFMVSPSYPNQIGEFGSLSNVYVKDITSLIDDDPLILQRMELFIAAREELGFSIDAIVEIDVQGYTGSGWENMVLGGRVLDTQMIYPDYGGGTAQDAYAVIEEHNLIRDIVIIPDPKYSQYRLLVRNDSFDDTYGVGQIYFKRLLNKTAVNKVMASFRDVNVLKNLKIFNGSEPNTYIQFVMRKSTYTNTQTLKVYVQAIIEGQFAGEKLIEEFSINL